MPLISVTRLHLRSLRFFPAFFVYTMRSQRQLRRTPGFRAGWLGTEGMHGFWTATAWESAEAMRAFRNGAPHLAAMQKLLGWCDAASYAHWEQPGDTLPDGPTALARLLAEGRVSKVHHPSEAHRAGRTAGAAPPRPGGLIRPVR